MYNVLELKKSYGSTAILRDISLRIDDGEAVTIIGPSGSGKSTFLRCLNLLEEPTGGKITLTIPCWTKTWTANGCISRWAWFFRNLTSFPCSRC